MGKRVLGFLAACVLAASGSTSCSSSQASCSSSEAESGSSMLSTRNFISRSEILSVSEAPAGPSWIFGAVGESCTEACQNKGGCIEDRLKEVNTKELCANVTDAAGRKVPITRYRQDHEKNVMPLFRHHGESRDALIIDKPRNDIDCFFSPNPQGTCDGKFKSKGDFRICPCGSTAPTPAPPSSATRFSDQDGWCRASGSGGDDSKYNYWSAKSSTRETCKAAFENVVLHAPASSYAIPYGVVFRRTNGECMINFDSTVPASGLPPSNWMNSNTQLTFTWLNQDPSHTGSGPVAQVFDGGHGDECYTMTQAPTAAPTSAPTSAPAPATTYSTNDGFGCSGSWVPGSRRTHNCNSLCCEELCNQEPACVAIEVDKNGNTCVLRAQGNQLQPNQPNYQCNFKQAPTAAPTSAPTSAPAPVCKAVMYTGITVGSGTAYTVTGVGVFLPWTSGFPNNRINSVEVFGNCKVTVCKHGLRRRKEGRKCKVLSKGANNEGMGIGIKSMSLIEIEDGAVQDAGYPKCQDILILQDDDIKKFAQAGRYCITQCGTGCGKQANKLKRIHNELFLDMTDKIANDGESCRRGKKSVCQARWEE